MSSLRFPEVFVQAVNDANNEQVARQEVPQISQEEAERSNQVSNLIFGINSTIRLLGPLAESSNVAKDVILKTNNVNKRLLRKPTIDSLVVYKGWGLASRTVVKETGDSGGWMHSDGYSKIKGLTFDKRGILFEYQNLANYQGTIVTHTLSKVAVSLTTERSIPSWLTSDYRNGKLLSPTELIFQRLVDFASFHQLEIS